MCHVGLFAQIVKNVMIVGPKTWLVVLHLCILELC